MSANSNLNSSIVLSLSGPKFREKQIVLQSPGKYIIGSHPDAAIQVPLDDETSPRHAMLCVQVAAGASIKDLESVSGTYVNGRRIETANLKNGDLIRCGTVTISITVQQKSSGQNSPTPNVGDQNRNKSLELSGVLTMTVTPSSANPAVSTEDEPQLPPIKGYAQPKFIGRGALGIVYRSIQLGTNRAVAIKCIRPELQSDERTRQVFIREASIASQLKHPRIVECLGFGIAEGRPYLVMEYIPSVDLETVVLNHSPKRRVRLAVKIALQLLDALSHAHSTGIVHRDIKPSNILASTADGRLRLKVTDFGLAKIYNTAGYSGITTSGEICGTLAYMSPEQLVDSRRAKPESDVYSAVVCLYRLLTGEFPFPIAKPSEMIHRRLNSSAIPVKTFNPEIPEDLAWIVDLGLSRALEMRYPSASVLRDALAALPLLES